MKFLTALFKKKVSSPIKRDQKGRFSRKDVQFWSDSDLQKELSDKAKKVTLVYNYR